MFNIGGGELIVIMLLALIVLGPQRLPDAARQIGKTMGELRRLSTGFQNEMKHALDTVDDPTRVADRRNVLARDAPEAPAADPEAADAIASVSAQPTAPAKKSPPAGQARTAARKTPLRAAPVEEAPVPANGTSAEPPAAKPAGKKKTAATVSKAAPRRTKG